MTSEQQNVEAILAALNTPTAAAGANAYTLGQLKAMASPPTFYTEVVIAERVVEGGRLGGRSDIEAWRIVTRAVATVEENARLMRHKAKAALLDRPITVAGIESTPIERGSSEDPIALDETWYSGTSEWTYAL